MDQNFRASEPDIVYDSRVANRASIDAWTSGTSALSNDWPHAVERGRPGDKPWGALIERPVARSYPAPHCSCMLDGGVPSSRAFHCVDVYRQQKSPPKNEAVNAHTYSRALTVTTVVGCTAAACSTVGSGRNPHQCASETAVVLVSLSADMRSLLWYLVLMMLTLSFQTHPIVPTFCTSTLRIYSDRNRPKRRRRF